MRNRTEDQMILALIRHGETLANAQRRYLGKTDEPLSKRGIGRLLSCKEQNIYPQADYLFTSPMKRCVETAAILYPTLEPIRIPEWEEMGFGRFEYKNYEELKTDADYQRWIDSGGEMDFPDGESRAAFVLRCRSGFQRMCRAILKAQTERRIESAGESVRVSAIVHGGTIMALLDAYGKGRQGKSYFDYQTANGRGYLCRVDIRDRSDVFREDGETQVEMEIGIEEIEEL